MKRGLIALIIHSGLQLSVIKPKQQSRIQTRYERLNNIFGPSGLVLFCKIGGERGWGATGTLSPLLPLQSISHVAGANRGKKCEQLARHNWFILVPRGPPQGSGDDNAIGLVSCLTCQKSGQGSINQFMKLPKVPNQFLEALFGFGNKLKMVFFGS